MKQLKSLITIQKLAESLRDFKIGPSDDFVSQYIRLENLMSRVHQNCHGKLLHGNCILISRSDSMRSRGARRRSLPPNVIRSLPARLYGFHDPEQKVEIKARI